MADDIIEDKVEDVADDKVEATAEDKVEDVADDKVEATADDKNEDTQKSTVLLSGDGDGKTDEASSEPSAEDFVYTPPEGVEIDDAAKERLEAFVETAQGMKLTPDQYQQLIDFDRERSAGATDALIADYQVRVDGWVDAVKKDKVLGGDKLNDTLRTSMLAQAKYGSAELAALFAVPSAENPNGLGIGNHPEIIRLFHKIGRDFDEDTLIEDAKTTQLTDDQRLERMYPTMFKNKAA